MLNPNLRDQLIFLRRAGCDVRTASIDGRLARKLRDEDGFPWTPLPLTREFNPLSDLRAVRFIERFVREQQFDIVHTHTPKGNLIGQWGARMAGAPIVLQTLHGFYFHDRMPAVQRRAWIEIEKFSAKFSDHILCQNPEDVDTALHEGIASPGKISELGNGTDLARFKPIDAATRARLREKMGIPSEARVIGMVGRFVREKGFPEFVEAARHVAKDYPDVHFLAVGHVMASERAGSSYSFEGPAEHLKDRFHILTDRDDMPELYGCMDIHVLPSHREGFPRALIEGAAMGLPQVATNIRGCRQVLFGREAAISAPQRSGEEWAKNPLIVCQNGVMIEPGDAEGLARALRFLLDDTRLCSKMSESSRRFAVGEFDQRAVFERLVGRYLKMIE